MKEHLYYVYVLASRSRNLYIGMTNNLRRRVAQHKAGEIEGITQKYRIERLVYFERYEYVRDAISREKELKGWRREKKIRLIETENSSWADLAEDWDSVNMKFRPEVYRAALERTAEARRNAGPSPAEAGFGMTSRPSRRDDSTSEYNR